MTEQELKEIEDRAAKASDGPWVFQINKIFGKGMGSCRMVYDVFNVADIRGWGHLSYLGEDKAIAQQDANGDFIAHAREDVPRLIATIREREDKLAEAKKTIDSLHEEVLDEIQHRDHFENQCSDMAAQAGCSEEWSNLHDHSTCVRDEVQALLNHHDELEARLSDKESTVARMRAEREDWQASVKAIMDTSCNQDEKHCTCVPLLRAKVDEINENYEDMITHRLELESTVVRLREALIWLDGYFVLNIDGGGKHGCPWCYASTDTNEWKNIKHSSDCLIGKALSPSPSANSGEKPGITEQELKDRGYVDLTKLGGNDWRLQRYGECAACGGNLTADHQCPRRKSVSPGEK